MNSLSGKDPSLLIKAIMFYVVVFNLDSLQILGIASFRKGNITVYAKLNFLLRMLSNKNTNIFNNTTSLICIGNDSHTKIEHNTFCTA